MPGLLTKREPGPVSTWLRGSPVQSFRDEMEGLFEQFFGNGNRWAWSDLAPSLDVSETDQTVEVRMDVPGVKPADIDIQLAENVLTITGKREEEKEEKGKTFHRMERKAGTFSRSVSLPCGVRGDKVDANYKDGVLTISLPKSEEAKAQKIKVKG